MHNVMTLQRLMLAGALLLVSTGFTASAGQAVPKKQTGTATYYAKRFHGRKTASGARFDQGKLVAAHHRWPLGTLVRVTNTKNDRTVKVRIVDRLAKRSRAVIDLSRKAARQLRFLRTGEGRVPVRLEVLEWGHRKH
jgi:rare lipoprotein A